MRAEANGKHASEEQEAVVEPALLALRRDELRRTHAGSLASVGAWLRARLDVLVEEILAELRFAVPSYRRLDAKGVERFRRDLGMHVRALIDLLVEGRSFSQADLNALAVLSHDRLRRGVPLEDLLLGHHVGTGVVLRYLDRALEEAVDRVAGREVRAAVYALAAQVAGAIKQAAESFREVQQTLEDPAAELLDALLDPTCPPDRARDAARELGVRLSEPLTVAVVVDRASRPAGPGVVSPGDLVHRLGLAIVPVLPRTLLGWRDGRLVCLVPGNASAAQLEAAFAAALHEVADLAGRLVVGVGGAGVDLAELHRSYREAVEVVGLLVRSPALPSLLTFRAALPYRILDRLTSLADELVREVVEPLRDAPELLATLRCFLEVDRKASKTAELLGVDPKTFYAYAERIERLTGLRLTDPGDHLVVELSVASYMLRLDAEQAGMS